MNEEGFVNGALNLIKSKNINARFLANQVLFNGHNNKEISASAKASIIFSINVYNLDCNDLDTLLVQAINATTIGEIKQIIQEVNQIKKERQ